MTRKKAQNRNLVAGMAVGVVLLTSFDAALAAPPLSPNRPSTPAMSSAVNQLLADVQKSLKAGNLPLAIIQLKNASSAAPSDGTIRARLGIALLQLGDYYSTERELRQARKDGAPDQMVLPPLFQVMLLRHEEKALLDEFPDPAPTQSGPSVPDLLKARALALQGLGQTADAVAAMDRSLKLRRDTQGLLSRARLAQGSGDFTLAKGLTDEAIQLSKGSADAMLFKVTLLMGANDDVGALDLANQLVAKYPDNLAARFPRIEVLMRMRQDAKAKADVDAILAKSPGLAIGTYYKALLMARAGDAQNGWRLAQTLPPEFMRSQPSIALVLSQMADSGGSTETGAAILSGAIQKFPDDVGLRLTLAGIRLKQNTPQIALAALEPIKDSPDPRVSGSLANIYLKLHRNDDALAMLQKLNKTGKGNDASKREAALLEMQLGQSDQGIKDLAGAAAQQPTNAKAVGPFILALVQKGRFAEALSAADRLASDPKQHVEGLVLRAQILLVQRNIDAALSTYDKAVQSDPKNVVGLSGRATLLLSLRRYDDAARDLHAVLVVEPKNLTARLKLAEVAADQGQDQNVRGILGQTIALAPQNPVPRLVLTRYLMSKKDFKGATVAVNDLLRFQPKNSTGLALLGQNQFALGQKSDAVKTFRRLVAIAPNTAAAQVLLGNALFVTGDRGSAMLAVRTAVKLDPNSADARIAQINLQLAGGDPAGAVASAHAFQIYSPGTTSDVVLADTLAKAKHADQAIAVLQRSFADKPNNVVLQGLVKLSLQSGDKKYAADIMSKWLEKNPADENVRVDYGMLLLQQGNKVEAANQFQTVLKSDPNNVASLNNLGWLKQGTDPRGALALVTSAAKLTPNSPEVLDTLGWMKLQQKDAVGGLPLLDHAHQLRPMDGTISYHLAVALDANGKRDAARALLKSLLASGAVFDDRQVATQLSASWH